VSAVAHGEERIGPEITPEEPNYNRDEGLALQLLCDCLHVPFPDMKDGSSSLSAETRLKMKRDGHSARFCAMKSGDRQAMSWTR
jgi:hypothetical protein